jgi:hypothetical protein
LIPYGTGFAAGTVRAEFETVLIVRSDAWRGQMSNDSVTVGGITVSQQPFGEAGMLFPIWSVSFN